MIDSKKKVIFLYASKYSGHQHAALAIKQALLEQEPSIESIDIEILSFFSPPLGRLIHKAYLQMIKKTSRIYDLLWDNQKFYKGTNGFKKIVNQLAQKKFRRVFKQFNPQVAVCTQALPCGIISRLKEKSNLPIKLIAVITDYDIHSYWIYKNVDFYMVATEGIKKKLQKKGISSEKIRITGIPVYPVFSKDKNRVELRKKLGIDNSYPVILIMGGSYGLGPILGIIRKLNVIKENFQFIVVAGRNQRLKRRLQSLAKSIKNPLKIYGYVNNIDELMSISDLLITKPGGITITEALIKKIPLIIYNAVKGQESRNYQFLINKQMAVQSKNLKILREQVSDILGNSNKRKELIRNIESFIKPDAADEIANTILKSI